MKNKYNVKDRIKFETTYLGKTRILEGEVYIVDRNGIFGYPDKVSYDVMVDDFFGHGTTLCKHIFEEFIKPV